MRDLKEIARFIFVATIHGRRWFPQRASQNRRDASNNGRMLFYIRPPIVWILYWLYVYILMWWCWYIFVIKCIGWYTQKSWVALQILGSRQYRWCWDITSAIHIALTCHATLGKSFLLHNHNLLAFPPSRYTPQTLLCLRHRKSWMPEAFCFRVCPSVSESASLCVPDNLVNTISQKPMRRIPRNFGHRCIWVRRCADYIWVQRVKGQRHSRWKTG